MTHPEPYWTIPAAWLLLLLGFCWLASPRKWRLVRAVAWTLYGAAVRARLIK